MTTFDFTVALTGIGALIAGVILLSIDTSDTIASALLGLGIGLLPVAVYTAHERPGQEERWLKQAKSISAVSLTVEPPRMSQLTNAIQLGKTMFAASGPNVSKEGMKKYIEDAREIALAMGGNVPSILDSLIGDGRWPRRMFKSDGLPIAEASDSSPIERMLYAVERSVDFVVSKAFALGFQLQLHQSLLTVRMVNTSPRAQYVTEVIFESEDILKSLSIVYQSAKLGPMICEITEEVLNRARRKQIALEDLSNFFVFLQWFTASLSHAYDGNVAYSEVIREVDDLLDQIRDQRSPSEVSDPYAELASLASRL